MLLDAQEEGDAPGPPLPVGKRGRVDARGRYVALNCYGCAQPSLMARLRGLLLCGAAAADCGEGSSEGIPLDSGHQLCEHQHCEPSSGILGAPADMPDSSMYNVATADLSVATSPASASVVRVRGKHRLELA
eukprot:COSAG01_NODE_9103_length_2554_cov_1.459063_2_plen_132_part_00